MTGEHDTIQAMTWTGDSLPDLLRAAADWIAALGNNIFDGIETGTTRSEDWYVTVRYIEFDKQGIVIPSDLWRQIREYTQLDETTDEAAERMLRKYFQD